MKMLDKTEQPYLGRRPFLKCDAAHTSFALAPLKSGMATSIWRQEEGTHGTQTSYRRDCSCNAVDHPNGHGVGHAELVTDFRSSTFAFVLRQSDQLLPPTLDARQAGGRCCVTRSPLASTSKCLAQMNKSPDVVRATNKAFGANRARAPTMRQSGRAEFSIRSAK